MTDHAHGTNFATPDAGPGVGRLRLAGAGLAAGGRAAGPVQVNPLAARAPHFPARAKRIIFLFMKGGPSHVDTFDPKPLLDARRRQAVARSPSRACSSPRPATCSSSPWKFKQHGESGIWVSELFPHVAERVDDLCMIHSRPRHQPGPRRGLAQAAHRQRQLRPPEHRLVGQLRPGHRERATCPASSPSARRWPTAASTTGAPRSCRPSTRARRWATPACRPTRPGSATSATPRLPRDLQRLQLDLLAAAEPRAPAPKPAPSRRWRPASIRSSWPSACRRRCRRSRTSPANPRRRSSCTAWTTPSPRTSAGSA